MFDYAKNTGQHGIMSEQLIPHPDGKPWPKCCRGGKIDDKDVDCAFIRTQDGGARLSIHERSNRSYDGCGLGATKVRDIPFMCAHRSTDDGYHRVCAGWDACFGNKSLNGK